MEQPHAVVDAVEATGRKRMTDEGGQVPRP
jgi:hypothetical protein